jgi:hypothetical protein
MTFATKSARFGHQGQQESAGHADIRRRVFDMQVKRTGVSRLPGFDLPPILAPALAVPEFRGLDCDQAQG